MSLWGTERVKMDAARAVIKKYEGQWTLSPKAAKELEDAHKDIAELQEKCYHTWEDQKGFTLDYKVCKDCGLQKTLVMGQVPPDPPKKKNDEWPY